MDKFEEYKSKIEATCKDYTTLLVDKESVLQNGVSTAERSAPYGFSWIDYWRAMSGVYKSLLECSSCGKMIFADGIPPVLTKIYAVLGLDENEHKALGGHLLVKEPQDHDYPGGFYITPLCPKCKAQRGKEITIRQGSVLCKEITIEKNNDDV